MNSAKYVWRHLDNRFPGGLPRASGWMLVVLFHDEFCITEFSTMETARTEYENHLRRRNMKERCFLLPPKRK